MIASKLLSLPEGQFAYALTRDDLGPIFVDRAPVANSALSPFYEVLQGYARGSAPLSPTATTLLADPDFAPLLQTLAAPQLLVRSRLGGGSASFEEMRLCASPSASARLLAVAITDEGAYLIRVFEDSDAFVAWWMESFAGRNDETIANYVPPRVALGAFLLILHTVDMFRRIAYQRTLDFDLQSTVSLRAADFAALLPRSLQSMDLRWLLPTFATVTPNLGELRPNIVPEHAQALNDLGFVRNTQDPQSGEDLLLFGEAGQAMGVEFMRSWFLAAGFEFTVQGSGSATALPRLFIAPTALANHFVQVETPRDGRAMVNHQAYTYPQLEVKLQEIMEQAFALCTRAAQQALPSQPATSAQVQCPHCGQIVPVNVRFCVNCGQRVG
jgi:hypothetical protein